jgi:hypothetical protein
LNGKGNLEGIGYTLFTPLLDFVHHLDWRKTIWDMNFGKIVEGMVRIGLVREEALAAGIR